MALNWIWYDLISLFESRAECSIIWEQSYYLVRDFRLMSWKWNWANICPKIWCLGSISIQFNLGKGNGQLYSISGKYSFDFILKGTVHEMCDLNEIDLELVKSNLISINLRNWCLSYYLAKILFKELFRWLNSIW